MRMIGRQGKYNAVPTVIDNIRFDSKREAARYQELRLLEKAGEIRGLCTHLGYPLYAARLEDFTWVEVCIYEADFVYWTAVANPVMVVEDVKSKATRTATYRLKRKLFEANYGISITEVE